MKKVFVLLVVVFLLSACTAQPKTMTEKNAPESANQFNEMDLVQEIVETENIQAEKTNSTPPAPPVPPKPNNMQQATQSQPAGPATKDLTAEYNVAVLKTNMGDIKVKFYNDLSPKTVNNFLNLADAGFYDGTRFHRVINDFMIQGGDPNSRDESKKDVWGTGGPGYKFADEFNDKKLVKGSLAMANSGPNTNGSQFFIVTKDSTPWLDGKHTNFGEVVEGLDVVESIEALDTDGRDRPQTDAVINSIELLKE